MKHIWYVLVFILIGMMGMLLIGQTDYAESQCLNVNPHVLLRQVYRDWADDSPQYEVVKGERDFESNGINLDPLPLDYHAEILSVGDIMAHTIQFEAAQTKEGYDFSEQFAYIADKVQSKDFAIANFETVMAGEDRRYSGKNMIFNAPDSLAESVKAAGFDLLTTANNHALDRGYDGISRTLDVMDDLGLLHVGTNRTAEERDQVMIFEVNHIKIALLSYSFSTNGWPMPEHHPYALNMMEEKQMLKDIDQAKKMNPDLIMVAVHWGLEYHLEENHHQRDLAEKMFYQGADIILGTHPHVIQPFEHLEMVDTSGNKKDKFIIYSQGNFLSGQRTYPRAIGMYINFDLVKHGIEPATVNAISVMPTYVESSYRNHQRYMRVLETIDRDVLLEAGEISTALYEELSDYESTFIKHISSRLAMQPYLNDSDEYVIYEK